MTPPRPTSQHTVGDRRCAGSEHHAIFGGELIRPCRSGIERTLHSTPFDDAPARRLIGRNDVETVSAFARTPATRRANPRSTFRPSWPRRGRRRVGLPRRAHRHRLGTAPGTCRVAASPDSDSPLILTWTLILILGLILIRALVLVLALPACGGETGLRRSSACGLEAVECRRRWRGGRRRRGRGGRKAADAVFLPDPRRFLHSRSGLSRAWRSPGSCLCRRALRAACSP